MKGLQPLKLDLRDKAYQRHKLFGASKPIEWPLEYRVTGQISDNHQGGSQLCTCYATVAMAEREDGNSYSREFHAKCESKILGRNMATTGADLRTALDVSRQYGFLLKQEAPFDWKTVGDEFAAEPKNWPQSLDKEAQENAHPGYTWVVPNNGLDYFDALRGALFDKKPYGSISVGIPWFREFQTVGSNGILSHPFSNSYSYHDIEIIGWHWINGVCYLVANPWEGSMFADGGVVYISRDTMNYLLSFSGTAAATLDTIDSNKVNNLQRRVLSLLQMLIDLLQRKLYQLQHG